MSGDAVVVDCFAGGGGASLGIEAALRRPVDEAINHDPLAVAMHAANHPRTRHWTQDIWQVDPARVAAGRPVSLAWFSPDCTHFSKAKGGKPRQKNIRDLAWVVVEWARAVQPRVIMLENVEEFRTWGPLDDGGYPIKSQAGETFAEWVSQLRALGYEVEWRELRACDYGAPTIRKRLFLIARCDGLPIEWPSPSHGRGLLPYRTAAECIDWNLPCPSIFDRKKPLAEATQRRIANGIRRYVLEAPEPFIVRLAHGEVSQGGVKRWGSFTVPLDRPLPAITLEPRTFTEETYRRWAPLLQGPWRFAFDTLDEGEHVQRMMGILHEVPPKRKRVYVLIGNEPMEACLERATKVIEWGGEPFCQPFTPLNALRRDAWKIAYDWTPRKLRDFARYFNRYIWRYAEYKDYDRSVRTARPTVIPPAGGALL